MLNPSGVAPMVTTSAPSSHSTSGAVRYAAPLAQSTTIFSPSSRRPRGKLILANSIYRPRPSSIRVARPMPEASASPGAPSSNSSICSSTASESLNPSGPKNLMPLSWNGLCEAEIITPRSARIERVRKPTAGVGTGPTRNTFIPTEVKPDVSAVSIM